ncbi:NAD(P)H-binding protein [Nocardia farcinica]|uniref:NAD(P)H-binding protein n=1 Tax=Nocardia farcinica TaxID=37329 RepID=UPI002453EDBC|nr:NAD(P)H-binding protein [Nocardia farcinica]
MTGATGSIGNHLVRALHRDGTPLRALVRHDAGGRALGCDYVVGDFDDPRALAAALDGVDRLFLNSTGAIPVDGEQPMIRWHRAAIDAARAAGVEHVVKVSVWHAASGAPLSRGAHFATDEYLKASGLGWSLLRPTGYMQNFLSPAAFTADGKLVASYGEAPVAYIDCRDIAACAAALLAAPAPGSYELTGPAPGSYELTGPAALTDADIAATLATALDQPVSCAPLPATALAAALVDRGLPPRFAADLAVLVGEVADGDQSTTTSTVADLTGHPPRTFARFATDHRPALLAALQAARSQP